MPPSKRATAADVARASGVSSATVSYVLNSTPGQTISAATRERVLAAAGRLGYTPSAYAQALATGRSRVVVVDLSEIPHGQALGRAGREIAAALDARGYLPIVDQPERGSGTTHRRLLALAAMLAPSIVLTVTPLPEPVRARLAGAGVEHFAALLGGDGRLEDRVDAAAHTQVAYLASRGHRSIAYCGTDQTQLSTLDRVRRSAVFEEAATQHVACVDLGSPGPPAAIAEVIARARSAAGGPSAVAAYNDETAFAVLSAAHRLGLRVPDQIAVMGIDDSPLAAASYPTLTTVGLDGGVTWSPDEFIDRLLSGDALVSVLTPRVVERESA